MTGAISIVDRAGHEVPVTGLSATLRTRRRYSLRAPEALEASVNGVRLAPSSEGFELPETVSAGWMKLQVTFEDGPVSLDLQLDPDPQKLDTSEWIRMVQDVEGWLAGSSAGLAGASLGEVASGGSQVPWMIEAALPLLGPFFDALRDICRAPRTLDTTRLESVAPRQVRRVDVELVRWASRRPMAVAALAGQTSTPVTIVQRHGLDSVAHAANRYVVWLVHRVAQRLERAAAWFEKHQSDDAPWMAHRSQRLRRASSMMRALPLGVLSKVPPAPLSEAAALVVLGDPRYARLHRLGRRLLHPRLREALERTPTSVPQRPTYDLFELWTYLALTQALRERLQGANEDVREEKALLNPHGTGEGAEIEFTTQRGRLNVRYNPPFRSVHTEGNTHGPRSLSGKRRPDIVLTWRPEQGQALWLCLDAKYRVTRSNLHDAFSSVHVYRDALRYDQFGGATRACLLLVPNVLGEASVWSKAAFIAEHGMGIWETKPGGEGISRLAGWVISKCAVLDATA